VKPAWSVILLSVFAGAAQGLVALLALATLGGTANVDVDTDRGLIVAALLLVAALVASFFHLGRPERAWRAATMWRTSWLSREVIALPAFIAIVAAWWWGRRAGAASAWSEVAAPLLALAGAAALWWCTAMIYACLRFVEEWAQPLTLVSFVLVGLSSGFVLGCALIAATAGPAGPALAVQLAAVALCVAAGVARAAAIARNARLRHRSTLQSATGIAGANLRQISMGMSAGSFNTREFFHRATQAALRRVRWAAIGLGFVAPGAIGLVAIAAHAPSLWWLAIVVQAVGLLADRWLFFAQAKHPQNLYYQVVS